MREVRNQSLETMSSPIRHVMQQMHNAIVNIAPENGARFDHQHEDFILEYIDDHNWVCGVVTANKHIRVSRKVMEVLWASALVYFKLYQLTQQRTEGRSSVSATIEFANEPDIDRAMTLLRWAIDSFLNNDSCPWPEELPQPIPNPVHTSDEDVADELSLCAIAFVLHHELAHIRLGHQGDSELDSERDADIGASSWIMDGLDDETDPRFVKRILGLALAMQICVVYGIHTGKFGGADHPRSFDRMINAIDRHVDDPNHPVWFFCAVMLKLHLDNTNHRAEINDCEFDSARHCVDSYIEALSRISAR